MKKWVCSICGYVHEGDEAPEKCPQCKAPASKFIEQKAEASWACDHVVGIAKGVDARVLEGLNANFTGECTEVGMYLAMARVAEREGYPEVGAFYKLAAAEEAEHAAKFAELLGDVVTDSTRKNLELRAEAHRHYIEVGIVLSVGEDGVKCMVILQHMPLTAFDSLTGSVVVGDCDTVIDSAALFADEVTDRGAVFNADIGGIGGRPVCFSILTAVDGSAVAQSSAENIDEAQIEYLPFIVQRSVNIHDTGILKCSARYNRQRFPRRNRQRFIIIDEYELGDSEIICQFNTVFQNHPGCTLVISKCCPELSFVVDGELYSRYVFA